MKKIINPFLHLDGYNCFGCAPNNPLGVKLEFYEDGDDIVSQWKPSPNYQGWLNTLHGGIQSVLLDEICGWVVMRKLQTGGVTSKMETRFLRPISTNDSVLTLRAHIIEQRRNIVQIEATLADTYVRVPYVPTLPFHKKKHIEICTLKGAKQKNDTKVDCNFKKLNLLENNGLRL